ncbi:hypothetical protein [Kitasatospora sp. NPDC094011]|uniref:hypothetical protein n=1 Tax=Kitasatospora sp. NPDC094011 TaxID=3364090 RepID=UPI00380E7163
MSFSGKRIEGTVVRSDRPHDIDSTNTPESQPGNSLINSDRFDFDPRNGRLPVVDGTSTGELRLDGTPVPVEICDRHCAR